MIPCDPAVAESPPPRLDLRATELIDRRVGGYHAELALLTAARAAELAKASPPRDKRLLWLLHREMHRMRFAISELLALRDELRPER